MSRLVRRLSVAAVVTAVVVAGWLAWATPSTAPVADQGPRPTTSSSPPFEPGATPSAPVEPTPWSTGSSRPSSPASSPGWSPAPSAAPSASAAGSRPPAVAVPPRRGSPSATPLLRAALDARLEQLRQQYGIPGISAAITFADGSTWVGDAGLADVSTGRAVTADTAFSVASVSKTFTAALILALVEDGRIGLDTPVRTYLPALSKIDPAITVRQLLDHTSGLRDFYLHPRIDTALLASPARVWDAARSLSYVGKPYAKPGTAWHYSNTNYLVLGLLAEAVGRAPIADQLRDRFFTPLGLEHTWYQGSEAALGPVAHAYRFTGPGRALPPIDLSGGSAIVPFTSVVTASGGAGSIASTAADLARWARMLYGGPALAPATRDAMVADVLRTAPYQPSVAYGLGVQAVDIAGHRTLGHSGRFLGARAAMRWLPVERIAIAVTTNQSRTDPARILTDLLSLAFQPQADCLTCPAAP